MKAILVPFLSPLTPPTPQFAFAQSEPELRLGSVVIASRHDVRTSTKTTQLVQDATPDTWPAWSIKLGWLAPRGGGLIAYLGHYQRQRLMTDGLLVKKGCLQPGQITTISDINERTCKTDETFAAGPTPGCTITVHTQADTSSPDPLLNPLKTDVCQLDNANMTDAILSKTGGSIADFTRRRQAAFRELEQVLNFPQSSLCLNREKQDKSCSLAQALPSELRVNVDSVSLADTVSLASTLTEILFL